MLFSAGRLLFLRLLKMFFFFFTDPGVPTNIEAIDQGNSSLNVSWSRPEGSVTEYVVYLGGQNKSTTSPPVLFENLRPGTVYRCNVTSVLGSARTPSDTVELATGK